MRFVVNLHLDIDGNRTLINNEFFCDKKMLLPKIHSWLRDIKMETGYRKTIIEKVLVNSEHDIAEEVSKYKQPVKNEWLPF